jgi:hypothetical protein
VFGKLDYVVDGFIDLSLPLRRLGHDPRDRPAMARDDDRFLPGSTSSSNWEGGFSPQRPELCAS